MRNNITAGKSNRRNLSGKLVLAAVVHQVTCNQDEAHANNESNNDCINGGAHDTQPSLDDGGGGGLRRLGRLMFSRRRAKQQPTCFDGHLIDNNNNNSRGEQLANDTAKASDETNGEQVIEFKFDLIVEERGAAEGHRATANANQAASRVGGGQDEADELGAGWKLGENVDELVESFVLDSNDVCLMSLGRPAETVISQRREWPKNLAPGHFHQASELAARTLAYSFQLLDGRRRDRHRRRQDQFHHQHQLARSGESESEDEANYYSIELGATLFACLAAAADDDNDDDGDDDDTSNRSSRNRFAIVDLLRESSDAQQDNWPAQTVDCSSLEQALESLRALTARLAQVEAGECDQDKRLLIFHLKLKQRINGGLFSNRMCVIDFQPKFTEMHPIFKSIFNGQALAYLKQRQLHLQNDVVAPNKHHHQAASLESRRRQSLMLLEAEWTLYKHLSAALIRTLVVVHVRRLAVAVATSTGREAQEKRLAHRLMLDNLCLLEFAHSIQRAAAQRLRRRKRHLRSHLASSTTSVASNQSATTTTCLVSDRHLFGASAPNSALRNKSDGAQTGSRSLRSRCQRRAMDIGMMSRRHKRLVQHHTNLSGPELTGTESSSLSTTSSGSRPQQHQRGQAKGSYAPISLASITNNININSDDSDSITSANLNSCSSVTSYLFQQNSSTAAARSRQQAPATVQVRAPWSVTEVEQAQIELTSALNLAGFCRGAQTTQAFAEMRRQTRASSVIQIDCPTTPTTTNLTTSTSRWCRQRDEDNEASDIEDSAVVIAEPPKQLKLEEFLTQLSSIISPIRAPTVLTASAKLNQDADNGRQVEATGEEDEDCKSHSSILEHLSSLALESNTRLNSRQQHLTAEVAEDKGGAQQVEQLDDDENLQPRQQQPTTGHLQRLLNSSVQLQRRSSPRVTVLRGQQSADIEDRLRASSASATAVAVSPSASSSSGVFVQSSSNCDSTSSCGSSLSTAPPASLATNKQPDIYASVVNKHHSHIKT